MVARLEDKVIAALEKQVELLNQNGISLAEKENACNAVSALTALLHELREV